MRRRLFILTYLVLLVATIATAMEATWEPIHVWVKPSLMVSLIGLTLVSALGILRKMILLVALAASLVGDVLLLSIFDGRYFLFGLLAFLTAHIAYIVLFLKIPPRPLEVPLIRKHPWIIFLLILFGGWMYLQVRDGAGKMAGAVLIYILIISTMSLTGLNRYGAVSRKSFVLVALGAVLFMASDSLLAWNKFVAQLNASPLWILSSYGLAQLCIVLGIVSEPQELS